MGRSHGHQHPCLLVKKPGHRGTAAPWTLGGLDALELDNCDLRRLYGD
jgi:hypothetical protein